jgi:hypothetical protein
MVEQFVLLHSNYLDEAAVDPRAALEKYKAKIRAIQDLCCAARRLARHNKTKKKRHQIR